MSASPAAAPAPSDREIVTRRVVDASRERVFRAWTEPGILARWWGPKDFTNEFQEFEPRPGGAWRFIMRGPDGRGHPNESIFDEVGPDRIVFRHVSLPKYRMTADFGDEAGKTRITWRMLFATVAERDKVIRFAPEANEQNLDRLEAQLAEMA